MDSEAGSICQPCASGEPPLSEDKIEVFMLQRPDWQLVEVEGSKRLTRSFKFNDFKAALAFTNRVGEIAEAAQHHPQIITAWGSVTVVWWTHAIGGLHRYDFIMARKTDELMRDS